MAIKSVFLREARFYGFMLMGFLAIAAWQNGLSEVRSVRDLMGSTPFHSVKVTDQVVSEFSIQIAGTMVKRRCVFQSLSGYIEGDGHRARIAVDTTPENEIRPAGNRPNSKVAEQWGYWELDNPGFDEPVRWEVHAHHLCQGQELEQTNLFASGDWVNAGGSQ